MGIGEGHPPFLVQSPLLQGLAKFLLSIPPDFLPLKDIRVLAFNLLL
jgi:hypothetical protein